MLGQYTSQFYMNDDLCCRVMLQNRKPANVNTPFPFHNIDLELRKMEAEKQTEFACPVHSSSQTRRYRSPLFVVKRKTGIGSKFYREVRAMWPLAVCLSVILLLVAMKSIMIGG